MVLDRRLLLLGLLAILTQGCHRKEAEVLVDTLDSKFHVGEKWHYQARPGEENSTLTVVKVESSARLGMIVHVSLDGLRIKSPHAPSGFTDHVAHMPFGEAAIEKSVTTLVAKGVPLPAFEDGYAHWRQAFDSGKGGIFTIPVAQGVDFIEGTLNQ